MRKRNFISLLLTLILLLSIPLPIFGADNDFTLPYRLRLTNRDNGPELFLEKDELFLKHLPPGKDFDYIVVRIVKAASGKAVFQETYRNLRGENYDVRADLSKLLDGEYLLQVFHGNRLDGEFWNFLYKGIELRTPVRGTYFAAPSTYQRNMVLYQAARKDGSALYEYSTAEENIESEDATIQALGKQICAGLTDDDTKAEKIYTWVARNISYDYKTFRGERKTVEKSAVQTLKDKTAVCTGYANLTAALLRSQGIPAKVVSGIALGEGVSARWTADLLSTTESNHVWNEAYINGRWVIMDTTWDSISGDDIYFDPTVLFFSMTHRILQNEAESLPGIETRTVRPNQAAILVNGKKVECTAYNTGNRTYFKLRDLAMAFRGSEKQFEVGYCYQSNSITLTSRMRYTPVGGELTPPTDMTDRQATTTVSRIFADGSPMNLKGYTIDENNYFMLRDLTKYFDIDTQWDQKTNTILLDTSKGYLE